MTRISAAAAILIGLVLLDPSVAIAQSDQDSQCFPWQEYRDGRCVAKPSQPPPPMPPPAPATLSPCSDGTRSLSGQCTCPINTHLDTSGRCVADGTPLPPTVTVAPTRKADDNVVCEGGTVSNGLCLCPAGFNVMPTSTNANGGTCVRTNAENCQGGEMTVKGTCLCNGQVVMSGETYLLEHINGKCVPKRCPVETQWHDGKCVALSAVSPSSAPEPKSKPSAKETPKESSDEEEHRHCGRGMVRTRSGCVAVHHKLPGIYSGAPPGLLAAPAPPNLTKYYRNYQNQTSKMPPPN